ncbi:MAG: hypothetical protein IJ684_03075 [Bacteroidales bacterium]|nr:hypothetical protein [Bacteroidales bacterium]
MEEKELKIMMDALEREGWSPMACDSPVPYFLNGVPAGYPESPGDYDGEYVMIPRELLKQCDFVVTVHGDSMKDAGIRSGDDVMVKHCDDFSDGDIVVAWLDGETTLKAFCRDEDGEAWLVPANDAYEPLRLSDYTTVYVLGRVTSVRRAAPRASYAMLQRRVEDTRRRHRQVTDELVRQAVIQVLGDIKVGRMWFAVYRVLVEVGYLPARRYDLLKERMDELFPDNAFAINPRDLSRMDVGSFSKPFRQWDELDAPVAGRRFRDYRQLASDLYALLTAD